MGHEPARKRKNGNGRSRPSTAGSPVYFLSLQVENVRCFGPKQTLDLSEGHGRPAKWTVLLGDNGTGKTTLLQCLAGVVVESVATSDGGRLAMPRVFGPYGTELRSTLDRSQSEHAVIQVEMAVGERLESVALPSRARIDVRLPGVFPDIDARLQGAFCQGYGATRRIGMTALAEAQTEHACASLFSEDASRVNAEEWLLRADYAASKDSEIKDALAAQRDKVLEILTNVLPDVTEIAIRGPRKDRPTPYAEFKTPYGWVEIDDLGMGYRAMIAWVVDLASRMFERYPDSPNPISEPAIVLVDEIDLHLHPQWQRTIMDYLGERFTDTQFIVTAHSPLVVQAAAGANIALLRREGDHVIIDNSIEAVEGWRVDQILTSDLFGLGSARPPETEKLLEERRKLLSKAKLSAKERKRLDELNAAADKLPYGESREDREAMEIIRRAAEHLKSEGK